MWLITNFKIKYKILLIAFVGVTGFLFYLLINFQVTQKNSKSLETVRNQLFPIRELADINIVRLDRIKEIWNTAVTTGDEDLADDALVIANEVTTDFQEIININSSTEPDVKKLNQLFGDIDSAAKAMQSLEEDSQNIGAVLEAARAGEQGRGFAVVADEVRNLASRTQKSTLEIQKTIEKLQHAAKSSIEIMDKGRNQVQHSVEQANSAGELIGI